MSTATATSYTGTFPGRTEELRHVRRHVAGHLADCPAADAAVLAASELAANAVLHSRSRGQQFTIRVQLHPDHLTVECHDAGGPWRPRRRDDDRPHGLAIVEALAGGPDGWGTDVTGDGGRTVWARLAW